MCLCSQHSYSEMNGRDRRIPRAQGPATLLYTVATIKRPCLRQGGQWEPKTELVLWLHTCTSWYTHSHIHIHEHTWHRMTKKKKGWMFCLVSTVNQMKTSVLCLLHGFWDTGSSQRERDFYQREWEKSNPTMKWCVLFCNELNTTSSVNSEAWCSAVRHADEVEVPKHFLHP